MNAIAPTSEERAEKLQGLDPSKPLGAFGSLPEGAEGPSAVIFLPVLNAKTLLDALNQNGLTVAWSGQNGSEMRTR